MSKGQDSKKAIKKKPAKTMKEKRKEKKEKKANKTQVNQNLGGHICPCLFLKPVHSASHSSERRQPAKPVDWYLKITNNRNDGIVSAYKSGSYLMNEIGVCFGLGYSMVSRIIKNSRFKM